MFPFVWDDVVKIHFVPKPIAALQPLPADPSRSVVILAMDTSTDAAAAAAAAASLSLKVALMAPFPTSIGGCRNVTVRLKLRMLEMFGMYQCTTQEEYNNSALQQDIHTRNAELICTTLFHPLGQLLGLTTNHYL